MVGGGGKVKTSSVLIGSPQNLRDWKERENMNFKSALEEGEVQGTRLGEVAPIVEQETLANVEKSANAKISAKRKLLEEKIALERRVGAEKFIGLNLNDFPPIKGIKVDVVEGISLQTSDNYINNKKQNKNGNEIELITGLKTNVLGGITESSSKIMVDTKDKAFGGKSLSEEVAEAFDQGMAKRRALDQEANDTVSIDSRGSSGVPGDQRGVQATTPLPSGSASQPIVIDGEVDVTTGMGTAPYPASDSGRIQTRKVGEKGKLLEHFAQRTAAEETEELNRDPEMLLGSPQQETALGCYAALSRNRRLEIHAQAVADAKQVAVLLGYGDDYGSFVANQYSLGLDREVRALAATAAEAGAPTSLATKQRTRGSESEDSGDSSERGGRRATKARKEQQGAILSSVPPTEARSKGERKSEVRARRRWGIASEVVSNASSASFKSSENPFSKSFSSKNILEISIESPLLGKHPKLVKIYKG